ncbi:MAG: hypothetical protein ABW352_06460 [Polyangiales bacterium]
MAASLRHLALFCLLAACSSDDRATGPRGSDDEDAPSDEASAEGRPDARAPSSSDASVRRDGGDAARPPTMMPTDPGGCASVSSRAEARLMPVDIVWAIDTSGSMAASFPAIQAALNTFSTKVNEAGIDAHIVLLAGAGLCVPAPLGSGTCGLGIGGGPGGGGLLPQGPAPDTKEPNFLHLDVPFGANEGMPVILNSYGNYKRMLRPDAHTHLVLTEDGAPLTSPDAVVEQIEGRGNNAWSPALAPESWTFHGVVCKNGLSGGACLLAFLTPDTTLALVERSGGIASDLALAGSAMDPFAELLNELAERVIVGAELSCDYDIPPVPRGEVFDRNLVNVSVSSAVSDPRTLPQAKSGACADNQAWAYDDDVDPKKIVLCPAACDALRAEEEAKLDVQFGCETISVI